MAEKFPHDAKAQTTMVAIWQCLTMETNLIKLVSRAWWTLRWKKSKQTASSWQILLPQLALRNKSRRTTRPRVSKCGVDLRRSSLQPSPEVPMFGVWSGTGTAPVLHEFTFPSASGIVFCILLTCAERTRLKAVEGLKPKTSWTKLLNATRAWYVARCVWMFWMFVSLFVFVFAWSRHSHTNRILSARQSPKSAIFSCAVQAAPAPTCANPHSCNGLMWSDVVWRGLDTHDSWISLNVYEPMDQNASCRSKTMWAEHDINVGAKQKRTQTAASVARLQGCQFAV